MGDLSVAERLAFVGIGRYSDIVECVEDVGWGVLDWTCCIVRPHPVWFAWFVQEDRK